MIYFNALLVILIPLLFGIAILSLILGKKSANYCLPEKLTLSFPLGLGFLTWLMFFEGIAGIPLTFPIVAGPVLALTAVISIYTFKNSSFCLSPSKFRLSVEPFKPLEWLLLALITLKVFYVYFGALVKPLIDVDAFQQYTIVGKGIFFTKSFTLPYLQQFIGDKPLLPFLAQGWAFLALGTANDSLIKVLFPTLFLSLILIFYFALRRIGNRTISLLFTLLVSSLPLLLYHATTAYADLIITTYYALATFYLFLYLKEQNFQAAAVSLILLGFAVWSKKAGLILAGINILFLFLFLLFHRKDSHRWRKVAIPFIIFLTIILPWLALGRMRSFEVIIGSLMGQKHSQITIQAITPQPSPEESKFSVIVLIFARKLFLYGDWQLTWVLFIISLLFFYQQVFKPPLIYLLGIILLDFTSLFIQFGAEETFRWLLDGTLFDRLVMNEVPVVLFFCAQAIIPRLMEHSLVNGNRVFLRNEKDFSSVHRLHD